MKALFISNDPTMFDPSSTTRTRMSAYAAAIGELHIVSVAGHGAHEVHETALHLYPVHAMRIFRIGALARRARTLILEHGIEVVSAQDPFEHGVAALRAIRGSSAKLHIQIHTDFLSPFFIHSGNWRAPHVRMPFLNRFRLRMAKRVLPKAAAIRVVSKRIADSLVTKYGDKVKTPSIIPIETPSQPPEAFPLPPHPFSFALIAVGRLEPEKRIEDILAALAIVHVKYPMAGLLIVGEGSERARLTNLVRSLNLASRVQFLGTRAEAWGLMKSAQAFIQASAYEGYGRTLIEAALARIPIITTDVGIVGEVFKGYEDVLATPVADPTNLAASIVGVIEDTAARASLVINAEHAAREHLESAHNAPVDIAADLARALV